MKSCSQIVPKRGVVEEVPEIAGRAVPGGLRVCSNWWVAMWLSVDATEAVVI